ncbi:MAG: putative phosphoserine phosphatase 2 [Candidatus Anoxychlamydiales bacterium]|nr:putative phosphoserine phosphatase 2 [Candidatus Anoxychlamydiales bacterium]
MSNISLYFVRHGQTDYNKQGRVQGHLQIPLNETGRSQAKDLVDQIGTIQFDHCYSSDLIRAKETAEIILKDLAIEIIEDERLRERNLGKHEGTPIEEYLAYKKIDDTGIEKNSDMSKRIKHFIADISIKHPNATILVVSHGGLIKRLILDIKNDESIDVIVDNTAFLHLRSENNNLEIQKMNGIELKKISL